MFNFGSRSKKRKKASSQRPTTCLPPVKETRLLEATLERRRRISENSANVRNRKRREYLTQSFMSNRKTQLPSAAAQQLNRTSGAGASLSMPSSSSHRSRAAIQAPLLSRQQQQRLPPRSNTVSHCKTTGRSAVALQNASTKIAIKQSTSNSTRVQNRSTDAKRAKKNAPVSSSGSVKRGSTSRKPLSPRNMNVENRKSSLASGRTSNGPPPKLSLFGFDADFEMEIGSSPRKSPDAASSGKVQNSAPKSRHHSTQSSSMNIAARTTNKKAAGGVQRPHPSSSSLVTNTSFSSPTLSHNFPSHLRDDDHALQPIHVEPVCQGFSSVSLEPSRRAVALSQRRNDVEEALAKQRAAEIIRANLGGAPLANLDPNNHKTARPTITLSVSQRQEALSRSKNRKRPRFNDGFSVETRAVATTTQPTARKKPRTETSSTKTKTGADAHQSEFAKQFGHRLKGRTTEDLKKSKYAAQLEDEQSEKLDEMLGHMAAGEEILEKLSKLHQKKIIATHCPECNTYSFKTRQVCTQQRHQVKKVETVQRFFSCGGCGRRDYTIHKRFMDRSCFDCGSSTWQKTGQRSNVAKNTTGLRLRNDDHMTSSRKGLYNALRAEKRVLVDED